MILKTRLKSATDVKNAAKMRDEARKIIQHVGMMQCDKIVGADAITYVIAEHGDEFVKIGCVEAGFHDMRAWILQKVLSRLTALQVGNPRQLSIVAIIVDEEKRVHGRWCELRHGGEWFRSTATFWDWLNKQHRDPIDWAFGYGTCRQNGIWSGGVELDRR